MREIKFRAWDEKTRKMVGPYTLKNAAGLFPWTERSSFAQYESCPEYHPVKVMQWTGLTDKAGREIYEGDVVRHPRFGCSQTTESFVQFEDGGFWPFADNWDNAPYPESEDSEVIGNIYENPELLTGASPRPEPASGEGPS